LCSSRPFRRRLTHNGGLRTAPTTRHGAFQGVLRVRCVAAVECTSTVCDRAEGPARYYRLGGAFRLVTGVGRSGAPTDRGRRQLLEAGGELRGCFTTLGRGEKYMYDAARSVVL
jgi:hypothetical protein